MIWSRALVCLTAVISLLLGAIWPNNAAAAVAPTIVPLGSIEAGLTVPGKLDVDTAGNLYVADIKGQQVLKFDASGDFLRAYDAVAASGRGLAVTPDGSKLYVATDTGVAILDGVTGDFTGEVDIATAGEVDIDAAGNFYVVDFANVQVRTYDATGNFRNAFSGYGTATGQFKSIDAMSVNVARSEVYVVGLRPLTSDDDWVVVQMLNTGGVYQGGLTQVGDYMYSGGGVAFDAVGREYYIDKLTGKLHVRATTTGFDPLVFDLSGSGAGQVLQPWDVAFDPLTSRLFVSSDSGEVEIFGVDGGTTPEKNVAPGLPTLLDPIANSEVATLRPQLAFANAEDLNGDSLVYDVQVSGSASLQYTVAGDADGETAVTVDQDLAENAAYSWQVMASDGELDSGWTEPQTFYVNKVEEAPSAPVLSSGLAGEWLSGADTLIWEASVDEDPLDSVSYLVEISVDDSFADPVVSETLTLTEVSLGALAGYSSLVPGSVYHWRVTAVDSKGLSTVADPAGSFRFESSMLSVNANLPDARVYLGGNNAYAGQFVGTTPLQMADMAAGPYTVVIERAGCETFIAQVELDTVGSVQVNADLLLAKAPELKKASALRSVKKQLQSAAMVAPFVVDFDNDDMADLLVGDDEGSVNLFRALAMRGSKVQYGAPESLDFGQLPGTALFVVDWDNDNKKDVLVGSADGTVSLYRNVGTDTTPAYDSGLAEFLRDGKGMVINVGSDANPAVVDIDNDGDKDLVVGSGAAAVYLYSNDGSDASPKLAKEPKTLISMSGGTAAPYFVDWDADGVRDLLIASGGNLVKCAPQDDGTFRVAETVVDAARNGLADGARFFVVDADGSYGKDVYIGQADGQVEIMRSGGKDFLPAVTTALLDKLVQIEQLATEAGVDVASEISAVQAEVEAGDFKAAGREARKLAAASPADSGLYAAAVELIALLDQ